MDRSSELVESLNEEQFVRVPAGGGTEVEPARRFKTKLLEKYVDETVIEDFSAWLAWKCPV